MTGTAAAIALIGISAAPPAAFAADPVSLRSAEAAPKIYIILFNEAPLATYRGGVAGLVAAPMRASKSGSPKLDAQAAESRAYVGYLASKQQAFLSSAASTVGRTLKARFTYTHALNGMAVELTRAEAQRIALLPGVASVQEDTLNRMMTDAGPTWIGAPSVWNGSSTPGMVASKGEGVVVGIIDSGINFDSASFAAVDADGYQHVNPEGSGNYLGTCASGGADAGKCNDKLIGAYSYVSPPAGAPDIPDSAADAGGHGSHTASTAGGNSVLATTAEGGSVPVSGVAPRANVIAYKVCFEPPVNYPPGLGTCNGSASAAAADQAVADGVDVLNFSISGGASPWGDVSSIAFNNATEAGIFVAVAAGNTSNGDPNPSQPGTVNHREPWTMGVAAATHDRLYSSVELDVPGFRTVAGVKGGVLTAAISGVVAVSTDPLACTDFSPAPAAGFIALIQRGTCSFTIKINNAKAAGAAAAVIYDNLPALPVSMDTTGTTIPSFSISQTDGEALRSYLQSHPAATGTAANSTPPAFVHNPDYGDIMASFSLRGPAGGVATPWDMIKPDISAPGVNILAAGHEEGADSYIFMSGTSMASPHVAGSAALLRAVHPDWTPMEIKSALMLTASHGLRVHDVSAPADAFNTGAGRIDLNRAAASALILDETSANMRAANPNAGGDLSALNLASLSKASCGGTCTFTRTFKNPTSSAQTFSTNVTASNGGFLSGSVTPANFSVAAGATQVLTFTVNVGSASIAVGDWSFGEAELIPASGTALSLPIAVRKSDAGAAGPMITLTPDALASTQPAGQTTQQTLVIGNAGDSALTWTLDEAPGAVSLGLSDADSASVAAGEVSLQIDSGLGTGAVGVGPGKPFVFLNRFSPAAADVPFTLERVELPFMGLLDNGAYGAVLGEKFDIYVYQDDDEDPSNGAQILGSVLGVEVALIGELQSVLIPGGIEISQAGDVLIAVVARDATGGSLARGDGGLSMHRSWVGGLNMTIPDSPDLAAMALVQIEVALPTFQQNFVLRGYGTRGSSGGACATLADVPWLSASPVSGSTAPNGTSNVSVSLDSTGMAAGTYTANVCVSSNDEENPTLAVPVSMTVTGGTPDDDIIFQDGFDAADSGICEPLQLLADPGLEATVAPFGSNPEWGSIDSHNGVSSVFCNGLCSDAGSDNARSGDWYAWFGGWSSTSTAPYTAYISQTVTIPVGTRFLNYWGWVGRESGTDTFTVSVDGTVVDVADISTPTDGYLQQSVNLTDFADGASHELKLEYGHPGSNGDGDFLVDDLTLDCTPTSSVAATRHQPASIIPHLLKRSH